MLGGRKLWKIMGPELGQAGIPMGRDRLFALLKSRDLLVKRRSGPPRTTNSRHRFRAYPNRVKDFVSTDSHQLWVSDITYLRTEESFAYLALVMDAFSCMIVGYDCSDTLEVVGALRAAQMALEQLPEGVQPIHHSDRGIQYACHDYTGLLEDAGVTISMTEQNHAAENSQAERLNGTLKREYGLHAEFSDTREATQASKEAVELYNHHRPHQALGYRTPAVVHGVQEALEGTF